MLLELHKRIYGIDPSELEPSKRKERYAKLESELNNLAGQERAKSSIKDVARWTGPVKTGYSTGLVL